MTELDNRWSQFPPLEWKDPARTQAVVRLIRDTTDAGVDDAELGLLYELSRGLHHDRPDTQGYVVELGTYFGGSSSAMAIGLRDSPTKWKPVITVDSYGQPKWDLAPGEFPHCHDDPEGHVERHAKARETFWKLGIAYHYVCSMTTRVHDTFWELWAKPIRVIFIDSSHLYERTCMQIDGALNHMVEDGWLVFHDYHDGEWGKGVIPAVNRFLDTDKRWLKAVYRAGTAFLLVHLTRKSEVWT